jgi:hypothetical protein
MREQDDGDLEVSPGETVTVAIEARDTAFLAHTGAISVGQWASVEHPTLTKEIRTFTVSATFSASFSFTIGFDFSPGPNGKIPATALYTTIVTGSGPGGAVRRRENGPASILPVSRVFGFEVGRG